MAAGYIDRFNAGSFGSRGEFEELFIGVSVFRQPVAKVKA